MKEHVEDVSPDGEDGKARTQTRAAECSVQRRSHARHNNSAPGATRSNPIRQTMSGHRSSNDKDEAEVGEGERDVVVESVVKYPGARQEQPG